MEARKSPLCQRPQTRPSNLHLQPHWSRSLFWTVWGRDPCFPIQRDALGWCPWCLSSRICCVWGRARTSEEEEEARCREGLRSFLQGCHEWRSSRQRLSVAEVWRVVMCTVWCCFVRIVLYVLFVLCCFCCCFVRIVLYVLFCSVVVLLELFCMYYLFCC